MQLKKYIFIYFYLFLFFPWTALHAQNSGTLKGIVTDASDKSSITGANIFDASDKTHRTMSDINGNYELKLPAGKHKIICSFISMKTDTFFISIDSSKIITHNIILESAATQLQTMVVSAGKYERKLEDITVSMDVIKPTLIENKNSSNIKDALEQTPGLDILDGEPQIRGGSGFDLGIGSRVAILIDGLPALPGDGGRIDWNFYPVENVAQIEVIKGASSVTYGSSALSGSINIRTAYAKDKPETNASIYSGLYDAPSVEGAKWWKGVSNFSGASVLHSQKFGQLDLVIGGMAIYDHGFIGPSAYHPGLGTANDTSITANQVGEKTGRLNFNLRYRPKNIPRMNFGINGNFMESSNNTSLVWDNDSSGIYRAFPHTMTLLQQTMFYVDPFINYLSSGGWEHSLRTRYFYTKNEVMNQASVANNPPNQTSVVYSEYQISKQFDKLGELHFTGGLIMNQTYSHSDSTLAVVASNNHLQNFAVYSQLDKKLWKVLNVSAGFREEAFKVNDNKTDAKPIFRSGLNLHLAKATFLRYSFGQGYRYPSITEKYIQSDIGGLPIYANPELQPESSWNTELGVKQGFKIKNFMGYFDAAAFWQEYQNTIEFTYGAWDKHLDQYGNPVYDAGFKYLNTGATRVRGAEVSVTGEGKISNHLKIDIIGDYTYTLPQALEPNKVYAIDSTLRPNTYVNTSVDTKNNILKYRFQHIAKIDLQLTYKKVSIGGDWRFYSFMQNIDTVFYAVEGILHSGIQQYRLNHDKGTNVFDGRIGVQITEQLKLAFIVNNIFNLSYSLRPLKIEAPRTFAIRLSLKI